MQGPGSLGTTSEVVVVTGAPGTGFFVYKAAPAKGTLIAAAVGAAGTDPGGFNSVTPVLAAGQWSPSTGQPAGTSFVNSTGDLSVTGPDNVTRLKVSTGVTGAMNPGSAYWFNDFGAVVMVIDPVVKGLFQYRDLGTASQGITIGAQVWALSNVNDPVNGTQFGPGVTLIEPIFGGFMDIVGPVIKMGIGLALLPVAQIQPFNVTNPACNNLQIQSPASGGANQQTMLVVLYGESNDGSVPPGVLYANSLLSSAIQRTTKAMFELQGYQALQDQGSAPATTAGFSTLYSSSGALHTATPAADSSMLFKEVATPAAPPAGFLQVYADNATTPALHQTVVDIDSSLNIFELASAPAAPATGYVQQWADTNGILHLPATNVNSGKAGNKFAVGTGPSDFAGTVFIEDATAPGTPGTASAVYSKTGQLHYVSEDGNDYTTGCLIKNSSGMLVNSVTPAAIAGIGSFNLGIGNYKIRGQITNLPTQAAGSAVLTFAGTYTAAGQRINVKSYQDGTPLTNGASTSLPTVGGAFTSTAFGSAALDWVYEWEGIIRVSAAGTITLQVSCTVAIDTWTIRTDGTWMEVIPL